MVKQLQSFADMQSEERQAEQNYNLITILGNKEFTMLIPFVL